MKKGGIREVNSFISMSPSNQPAATGGRHRAAESTSSPRSSDAKKAAKVLSVSEDTFSASKSRTTRPNRVLENAKVSSAVTSLGKKVGNESKQSRATVETKVSKVKSEDSYKAQLLSPSNRITSGTGLKSTSKKIRSSIAEEKRGVSHKMTMKDVYERRLGSVKMKKLEAASGRDSSSSVSQTADEKTKNALAIVKQDTSQLKKVEPKIIDGDFEYEYEDDFEVTGYVVETSDCCRTSQDSVKEDYESDFESFSESNDSLDEIETVDVGKQKVFVEEEKKMDSGSYDLTYQQTLKQRNQLNVIKEALQRENVAVQQSAHFPDNRVAHTDTNSLQTQQMRPADNNFLLDFNDMSMKSFSNVGRKHRNSKISHKIKIRGEKLLRMISLDTMHYTLFEMTPIPYDIFMMSYARKNTTQAYTQTNEDNLSSETQTEPFQMDTKWTQHPARITKNLLNDGANLLQILSGVGGGNENLPPQSVPAIDFRKLDNFVRIVGEELIALLEEELHETELNDEEKFGQITTEISSCVSCIKYAAIPMLKNHSVQSVHYDPNNSARILTVHSSVAKEPTESGRCAYLSIWNIHQPCKPKLILKSYGRISCSCFAGNDSSYVIAGHHDGSVSVWNIREDSPRYMEQVAVDNEDKILRTPSYTTGRIGHQSKVVEVDTVKLNVDNAESFNESKSTTVCTVEEQNVIIIWTLSRSVSKITDIGSAPWSKVKFFINQTINIAQLLTKDVFCMTTLKVLNENSMLVGTNAEFVLQCSLYGRKFKRYRRSMWGNSEEKKSSVTCLEICPYNRDYFAVGFSNGDIRLYNVRYAEPVSDLENSSFQFNSTVAVQWLWSKQDYILALDSHSVLNIYRFQPESCTLARRTKTDDVHSIVVSPFRLDQRSTLHFTTLWSNLVLKCDEKIKGHLIDFGVEPFIVDFDAGCNHSVHVSVVT